MKTDPKEPIYPEKDWANVPTFGLTKREYFAAMAMQGLCSDVSLTIHKTPLEVAHIATVYAEALIEELNNQ
jgi:hypothetical protein